MLRTSSSRSFKPMLESLEERAQPSFLIFLPQILSTGLQTAVTAAQNAQTQLQQVETFRAQAAATPNSVSSVDVAANLAKGTAAYQQIKDASAILNSAIPQYQQIIQLLLLTSTDPLDQMFAVGPFSSFITAPLQQQLDTVNNIFNDPTVQTSVTTNFVINVSDTNNFSVDYGNINQFTF